MRKFSLLLSLVLLSLLLNTSCEATGSLPAPTPIKPPTGTVVDKTDRVDFSWTPVFGAKEYEVIVAKDQEGKQIVVRFKWYTSSLTSLRDWQPGTYFWSVRSNKPKGQWSVVSNFFIRAAPLPPTQPTPAPPSFEETQALKISKAIDPQNPVTRNYAVRLAALYPGEYNIEQICDIYDFLYKNWKYVSDPRGTDYYASASESISNGLAGDCDDFAITIAALIEAVGGSSRVVLAHGPKGAHAYAEVYVGRDKSVLQYVANKYRASIWHRADDQGRIWLNLDWSARHPGGPYFEAENLFIVYPDGRWEKRAEALVSPPPPPPQPKLVTQQRILFDGSISLQPMYIYPVYFDVNLGQMLNVTVVGSFRASGGANNDIDAYIMSQSQYDNWRAGHKATGLYVSGRITSGNFTVPIATSGRYYLVFSNDFSVISSKVVFGRVVLTWQQYQ